QGDPERIIAAKVSPGFFQLLGVAPAAGRLFPADAAAVDPHEVVVSYGLWHRLFQGRADAVGGTLQLDGESFVVVGAMPPSFDMPESTGLWTPLVLSPKKLADGGTHTYEALGRLKPGVSREAAEADLQAIDARLAKETPDTNAGHSVRLLDLGRQVQG